MTDHSQSQLAASSTGAGFVDLGFAKVDIERRARQGFLAVVFGSGVTVVNIDNGFGAVFATVEFCRLVKEEGRAARSN